MGLTVHLQDPDSGYLLKSFAFLTHPGPGLSQIWAPQTSCICLSLRLFVLHRHTDAHCSEDGWGTAASPNPSSSLLGCFCFPGWEGFVLGFLAAGSTGTGSGRARQAPPRLSSPFPKMGCELGSNEKLIRQLC